MIDLEAARSATAGSADNMPVRVTARWLKQAITEIEAGRSAMAAQRCIAGPLDHDPAVVIKSDVLTHVAAAAAHAVASRSARSQL